MAKKGIVLSNGDGKVTFSVTSSAYIEDNNDSFVATEVTASSLKLNSLNYAQQILHVKNETIQEIPPGTSHRSALAWNGSLWTSSSIYFSEYSGPAGGDLSGSFPNPTVTNINNVNSGTLPVNLGGTGLNNVDTSSILKVNSVGVFSSLEYSGNAYENKILANKNGIWNFGYSYSAPDIRYYTPTSLIGSNTTTGLSDTFIWYKPAGKRYMRILAQGAGAAGRAGVCSSSTSTNGNGGGSGGFSDNIISLNSIPSTAIIYAGVGGKRQQVNNNLDLFLGQVSALSGQAGAGGQSGFYANSTWICNATGGGINFDHRNAGTGNRFNGSAGGTGTSGATAVNNSSGGAHGGGFWTGGGIAYSFLDSNSRTFFYDNTYDTDGKLVQIRAMNGATGTAWNGANTQIPTKALLGAGGAGGVASTGAGASAGGDGGDGFVLVICW